MPKRKKADATYPSPGTDRPSRVSETLTVNLYDAKTRLSELVDRAADGEEIIIAKAGTPMARLVPLPPVPKRVPGGWKGQIWIAEDFDDPLPPDIQALFEDPKIFPPDVEDEK